MYTLSEIVACLGGELRGQDRRIARLSTLESAEEGDLCFITSAKYCKQLLDSRAVALIVSPSLVNLLKSDYSLILTNNPYLYFARVASLFSPEPAPTRGIHASVTIGEGSTVAASTEIREHVSLGCRVSIGEQCRIMPGVVIGDDVVIGDNVTLYPNVTLYHGCQLGNRIIIHSGCCIGADGFGFAKEQDHWFKIPQLGRVIIHDDVEIGANSTIDRGALSNTIIGRGVKIDNLVQIAHNVSIGEHTAIAACTAIAGSTRIGAYCTIGGAAMFVGHIEIADRAHIGAATLVTKSVRVADNYASSYPFSTMKEWRANAVHVRHLDDMVNRIKKLERELKLLQQTKDNFE